MQIQVRDEPVLVAAVANELHALFPKDSCLAVINKTEREQQSAFLMILDSVINKTATRS